MDVPSNLPTAFTGDPLRLSQVLINLCNTAVAVGEPGTKLVVGARLDDENHEQAVLHFSVSGTGIRVSPEP